jgi:hypothetical protein
VGHRSIDRLAWFVAEQLQEEAREALIAYVGPAHCTVRVRVRVRRGPTAPVCSIRPVGRPATLCR